MSLALWLPLINDYHNQGLNNYEISTLGTISWPSGGKLGATCFQGGNANQTSNGLRIEDTFTDLLNGNYTVSVWVKPLGNHVHYNGSIFSSGNWNTPKKRWAFGVSQDNTKVDILCSDYNTYVNCSVPVNEWTHLVCTCDTDRIVKLYKNGEYVTSVNRSASNTFDSDNVFTCIGRESYANGYFSFNGCLQDFRLYDECLSPLEIKQIAQGLILHYPLNNNGLGNENLAIKTGERTPDVSSQVEWRGFKLGNLPITTNETLTVSFDLKMVIGTAVNGYPYLLVYNTNYKGPHAGWIYVSNNSTNKMIPSGNYAVGDIIKRRVSVTITTPSSFTAGSQIEDWIEFYSNYSTENEITITNIKIERGNKATPWCPNSSDELATTMGFNSIVEYDCSGFGNNGTRTGTFTWDSNTAKYSVSQIFNGTNNAIQTPSLPTMVTDKNYTIACWTYKTVIGTKNYQTIYGGPSGFELEARSSSSTSPLYRIHNWGGGTTAYNFGEWTHFCFVHTDSNSKLYVNGELKITGTSKNIPSGNYFIGAWNTSTSQNYEGLMSDFRIYATALSADDVRALYENSTYIANNGTTYTYEFIEE